MATEHLQRELGKEPIEDEIYHELEKRLDRDPVLRARTETPVPEERKTAVASRSMEMMVASHRHEVFDMLMASAKGGDVSSILFLAGRLMPVPKARDYIRLADLQGVDLSSSDGVQKALELVLHETAAERMPLSHAEAFGRLLLQRLELAERAEKAGAYAAARAALQGDGGVADRLEAVRRQLGQLAVAAPGVETAPQHDAELGPWD